MPAEFRIDGDEIFAEIREQARHEAELLAKGREGAEDIKDHAVSISPVDEAKYAGAWHVEDRVRRVNGMPAFRIANDDPKAELIEDGTGLTGARPQGGSSPEFAVRARTAAHFNGTETLIAIDE